MHECPTSAHFNPAVSRSRPGERNFNSSILLVGCQGWGGANLPNMEESHRHREK